LLDALADPIEAAHYLNAAILDSPESFLKALGNVAQVRQMARVAKDSGLQRETLYRSLSEEGNPTFGTLSSVLGAVGLKMVFEPAEFLVDRKMGLKEDAGAQGSSLPSIVTSPTERSNVIDIGAFKAMASGEESNCWMTNSSVQPDAGGAISYAASSGR
jgi:probable addiction module antidote protein